MGNLHKYNSDEIRFTETVRQRVRDIYQRLIKLRPHESNEKLLLVADSVADLRVFEIMIDEAVEMEVKVAMLYYRTNTYDEISDAREILDRWEQTGVTIKYFDVLQRVPNVMEMAVDEFKKERGSVAITNIADDYDLRSVISDFARVIKIPILELPTIDMKSFISEVFSTDINLMRQEGNNLINEISQYQHFRLTAPDGTDLRVEINPLWINEAENNYDSRYWDKQGFMVIPAQDNPPGEVFTNIRNAEGDWVIYQFDNDVIKYALRNRDEFGWDINEANLISYIYDSQQPVAVKVKDGFVDVASIDRSSLRGQLLAVYLEQRVIEDKKYITNIAKHPQAACRLVEFAMGINGGAKNPDEAVMDGVYIDSALITEKTLGVWHIALGNTPCPDMAEYVNRSASHIDCGLRNPDLNIYGISADGMEVLLNEKIKLTIDRLRNK